MSDNSEALQAIIAMIIQQVTDNHKTLAEAGLFAVKMGLNSDLVKEAVQHLEEQRKLNYPAEDVVDDPDSREPWYFGPPSQGRWWEFYKSTLIAGGKRSMLPALDRKSTEITALLSDPAAIGHRRKGLVMGNVQSGKTANYTAVMAKSADAGYRFVIVLAGLYNNLRRQTQIRLDHDLLRDDWVPLTNKHEDFGSVIDGKALFNGQLRMAAVVKKNVNRLRNLYDWFSSVPEQVRRQCPVLIIDDEADQATPNSKAAKDELSAINKWLRKLWEITPTGTYVAYTATPFANVLMDPDDESDLFPSDFITTLPVGDGYFGAGQVFGTAALNDDPDDPDDEGFDMVRSIPDDDVAALRPPTSVEAQGTFDPELPESLKDAVDWFVVATAIRRARKQQDHSSMLVHTTHYTLPHERMKTRIAGYVDEVLKPEVMAGDLSRLESAWKAEAFRVSWPKADPVTWDIVSREIPSVLEALEVKVDNGSSDDRLDYTSTGPDGNVIQRTVVAVGGGTLSRGLTLEGLVVSYFTRTSNAYDTLLQMGRWFGYRSGYQDLPRIWVSNGLDEDYAFLARVEQDLRDEIKSLEGTNSTPARVGVRVRSHPGRLEVTARNKMFHAKKVDLTLSGRLRQTFLLDASDPRIVRDNVSALERLIGARGLEPMKGRSSSSNGQRAIRRDATSNDILDFLAEYHFVPSADGDVVEQTLMSKWVRKAAPDALWNVVVAGLGQPLTGSDGEQGEPFAVGGLHFHPVNRAPLGGRHSTVGRVDFKAIVSPGDRVVDLQPPIKGSTAEMMKYRQLNGGGHGLILAYPISHLSVPKPSSRQNKAQGEDRFRIPLAQLGIHHDLLGIGVLFPWATKPEGEFISVKTDWDVDDSYEELPEDTEGSSNVAGRAAE